MVCKHVHSRRKFLRYAMVGGVAVPITSSLGVFNIAHAKAFNFAADPNDLTDMERMHLPQITLPPVVEDGSQAPIQVTVNHPMEEDHYIKSIQNQRKVLSYTGERRGFHRHSDPAQWW